MEGVKLGQNNILEQYSPSGKMENCSRLQIPWGETIRRIFFTQSNVHQLAGISDYSHIRT